MTHSRRLFIKQIVALSCAGLTSSPSVGYAQAPKDRLSKTGVVLDPLFYLHDHIEHPENAKRLKAIDQELTRQSLWSQLTPVAGRMASNTELRFAHIQAYIDEIEILSEDGDVYYNAYQEDTYINEHTFRAAKMAAGSAINLNLAVYDRQLDNGFALLRPPGHHALENQAMGFCIFNSDVIAARALQKYRGVKRIAIIDFDVHHGNGTQDLTANDPSIMAISIHQHPFWPLTGSKEFIGEGAAKGTNINCPFRPGVGNSAYLGAYDKIIEAKLAAFKPEHIIVFAGYDAHWQDPLAGHRMSVLGFNQLVDKCLASAQALCGGRISFSLGGGYKLNPLAKSVAGTFHTLLNNSEKYLDPIGESPEGEIDSREQLDELILHHQDIV
jgi:acetoin utilization deacetylase AcuC-like enzyme